MSSKKTDLKKDFQIIRTSNLFDEKFYLESNKEINGKTIDLLLHFVCEGAKEGRDPNPLFSVSYYIKNNPDLIKKRVNPLAHYLVLGAKEGRDPHPLFDTEYYYQHCPEAQKSELNALAHYLQAGSNSISLHPLFDAHFYNDQNPDVVAAGVDPLIHYIWYGANEGRDPNPLFDTEYYFARNPGLKESGENPLAHYVETGWKEGKDPSPLFDTEYYFFILPDARSEAKNALEHFLENPQKDISPHPLFDSNYYLTQIVDNEGKKLKPILHYIQFGAKKRKDPHPFFNTTHYLRKVEKPGECVENPLAHFIVHGSKQGIDPHPLFKSDYYLQNNPDVRKLGIDALVHFVRFGVREGRDTFPVVEKLGYSPKISIIAPLTGFDQRLIAKGFESIKRQKYDNWELCLVGDSKFEKDIQNILIAPNVDYKKIRFKWVQNQTSQADLMNKGIGLSSGEFLLFFNMINELTPNALLEIVRSLNQSEDSDVIYWNVDKIDAKGNIIDPHFKPGWSLELFRQTPFTGPFFAGRRSVLQKAEMLNPDFNPVHQEELLLRIAEKTDRIQHIDKILCHRREIGTENTGECAHSRTRAWRRAVDAHLGRLKLPCYAKADADDLFVNIFPRERAVFPLVSIIFFDLPEDEAVEQRIEDLCAKTEYQNFEINIVTSASFKAYAYGQKRCSLQVLKYNTLSHLSGILNAAAKESHGEFLVFIDNQTVLPTDDWIQELLYYAEQPGIGAAGYSTHMGLQYDSLNMHANQSDTSASYQTARVQEITALSKSFMMIRSKLFDQFNGFNINYYSDLFDIDLCFRLRDKGYRIIQIKNANYPSDINPFHQHTVDPIDQCLFLDQWQDVIEMGDPYRTTGLEAIYHTPHAKLIRH